MSRRAQRRGRPYQPLPARRVNWGARLVIVVVAFILSVALHIGGAAILEMQSRAPSNELAQNLDSSDRASSLD